MIISFLFSALHLVKSASSLPHRAVHITSKAAEWKPLTLLDPRKDTFSLIVLNQPIRTKKERMIKLWNKALLRSTVDGGTTEWIKFAQTMDGEIMNPVPDLVSGDFDSLEPTILDHLRQSGAKVVPTPDQDETDFFKCVCLLSSELLSRGTKVDCVIVVVEISGRFDHVMANINVLFKGPQILGAPLYQLSSDSLTWVLSPGHHMIHIDERVFDCWCSFIPMGQPARVTTTGLKWNMSKKLLKFGEFISTSNQFTKEPIVTVETDHPVVFTMGIPSH